MTIKPLCGKSFMAIFHIKRRINIVQQIIFVLLILQISALFSYCSELSVWSWPVWCLLERSCSSSSNFQSPLYQLWLIIWKVIPAAITWRTHYQNNFLQLSSCLYLLILKKEIFLCVLICAVTRQKVGMHTKLSSF